MKAAVDCHMLGSRSPGDAGNGRYAATLVAALASAGADDEVLALIARPRGLTELPPGTRAFRVPEANVRRLGLTAARTIRQIGADGAVFTYVAPLGLRERLALAVHDPTFVINPEWLGRRARLVLRTLTPPAARRADVVLALSATAKADLCAALGLAEERVAVVSPPPAPVFRPAAGAAERVRERHGLTRYVLAVGDLGPRKNLPALLEAVDRLEDPTLELALVGRAGQAAGEVLRDRRARWLGRLSDGDLADLYRAAAVVAHPALYEGFGLTVLEALACGSPVVAARAGALPEVVGEAGILVRPTPDGLADGIRAALEPATADRLRAAGPGRASTFTLEAMGTAAWSALGRGRVG